MMPGTTSETADSRFSTIRELVGQDVPRLRALTRSSRKMDDRRGQHLLNPTDHGYWVEQIAREGVDSI